MDVAILYRVKPPYKRTSTVPIWKYIVLILRAFSPLVYLLPLLINIS